MLSPVEIAALVTATKSAIDIFDRIAGQIKTVLIRRPKELEGAEDRWRYKITQHDGDIVVKQNAHVVQTLAHEQLAKNLSKNHLKLIKALEEKLEEYYALWIAVYAKKDSSQDPLVNAQTDVQLKKLVQKMSDELLGILSFLQNIGVHLDDHYMEIRHLVEQAKNE